jgi:iron(III) transport system substrate-binding protein
MEISTRITLILTIAGLLLNSCGIQTSATPAPLPIIATPALIKPEAPKFPSLTPSALGQYMIPPYYPEAYLSIVEGSKKERNLFIYSSMSGFNWDATIETFNTHYPWIRVIVENTEPAGAFARYNAEISENKPTADMIFSSDPVGWLKLVQDREVSIYSSPEDLYLPDTKKSGTGSYAVSSEPLVIIYNKKLVPAAPKDMVELAGFVKNTFNEYKDQIAAPDIELSPAGFAANWFWANMQGQSSMDILGTMGESHPRLMDSEKKVVEAVGKGEVKIGYLIPLGAVIPQMKSYPDIGWVYMNNGQAVLLNSMAILKKAANPNSAKLMMDFILSQEGQYSIALGGLTPFRSDISEITDYHLDKIFTELGDNNVHEYSFDSRLSNQTSIDSFLEKWRSAVHKEIMTPTPEPSPTP